MVSDPASEAPESAAWLGPAAAAELPTELEPVLVPDAVPELEPEEQPATTSIEATRATALIDRILMNRHLEGQKRISTYQTY
jgi:hypothetical protein